MSKLDDEDTFFISSSIIVATFNQYKYKNKTNKEMF